MTVKKIFDLDITDPAPRVSVHAYRGDTGTRRVLFALWDGERPFVHTGATVATLYALKPDGTRVMDSCAVSDEGVEVTVSAGMTAAAGNVRCQIELACEGKVIACPEFTLEVKERVCAPEYRALTGCPDDWEQGYAAYYTLSGGVYLPVTGQSAPPWQEGVYYSLCDGAIESSDEFGALTDALLQARQALDEAGALRDAAEDGAFDGKDGASVYVAFTADGITMTESAAAHSRWVGFAQSADGRPEDVDAYEWVDLKGAGGSVTVDTALSTESENPVQNKAVAMGINDARAYTDSAISYMTAYTDNAVGNIETALGGI